MKVTIKMDNGGIIDTHSTDNDSQSNFCARVEEMIYACFKIEDLKKHDVLHVKNTKDMEGVE